MSLREHVHVDDMGDPNDATDRILAAFEQALLQPEVVEAAADAQIRMSYVLDRYDPMLSRHGIKAALTAIGAQPAKEGQG